MQRQFFGSPRASFRNAAYRWLVGIVDILDTPPGSPIVDTILRSAAAAIVSPMTGKGEPAVLRIVPGIEHEFEPATPARTRQPSRPQPHGKCLLSQLRRYLHASPPTREGENI
ncbi:hypothetical protein [Sphingosinithalassobacter sp. LHW66-3]|uniref:hypothetical protein n=1 Tax=Sphingosinithalassobacter sp. LHW66-3 TaxID=3424718 RepID=UPI003D6B2348